jgi:hypothetical protein
LTIKFTLNTECSRRATSFVTPPALTGGRRTCALLVARQYSIFKDQDFLITRKSQINNRQNHPVPDF